MSTSYFEDSDGKYYCLACSSEDITPREMIPDHGFIRGADNTCSTTYVCPNCKNVVMPKVDEPT